VKTSDAKPLAAKLLFEDLVIGCSWRTASRMMTQGEIKEFADLTGDFTPIHIDEQYASETPFRGIIAHGLLGLSILAGLSTVSPNVDTVALIDISGWRFRSPIYVGDEIHVVTEVADLCDHGRRFGLVKWYRKLINQNGEIVQDGMMSTLVNRRYALSNKDRVDIHPASSKPVAEPAMNSVTANVVSQSL